MINLRGHHLKLLYEYMWVKGSNFSFKNKKHAIIKRAIEYGHGKKHGEHIIEVLKKSFEKNEKIKLSDTIDDICQTCNNKKKKECREFIPYGFSVASGDRGALHFYGLQKRVYTSKFIQKRLVERGEM